MNRWVFAALFLGLAACAHDGRAQQPTAPRAEQVANRQLRWQEVFGLPYLSFPGNQPIARTWTAVRLSQLANQSVLNCWFYEGNPPWYLVDAGAACFTDPNGPYDNPDQPLLLCPTALTYPFTLGFTGDGPPMCRLAAGGSVTFVFSYSTDTSHP